MDEKTSIHIVTEFITLGQLLKFAQIIDNGGQAKAFLATTEVKVNGESENRRGRKLRNGDVIETLGKSYKVEG